MESYEDRGDGLTGVNEVIKKVGQADLKRSMWCWSRNQEFRDMCNK